MTTRDPDGVGQGPQDDADTLVPREGVSAADLDLYREDGYESTLTVRRESFLRRDTMPLLSEPPASGPRSESTLIAATLPSVPRRKSSPLPPPVPPPRRDLTATRGRDDDIPTSGDDGTSFTLSIDIRGDATREVVRLFLAHEYRPAMTLVNELTAAGHDDPTLASIARECEAALEIQRSGGDPRSYSGKPRLFSGIDGKMTLEQLAVSTGLSLEEVLTLLERFVKIGVLTVRSPAR